jgi:hypothetical protein
LSMALMDGSKVILLKHLSFFPKRNKHFKI